MKEQRNSQAQRQPTDRRIPPPRAMLQRLTQARSLLVVCHARPDGDALGCVAALTQSARDSGRSAFMLVPDAIPRQYAFLFADERPQAVQEFAQLAQRCEAIVVVDTCSFGQLDSLDDVLKCHLDKVLVIDHHCTADSLSAVQWQDASAAAAGLMLYELLGELGWPMGRRTLEALAVAILTDTGWLRFPNTDSRCLCAAARLIDAGVGLDVLYRRLYQADRPQRLRLMARMLDSLELHSDGRLAMMRLRDEDFTASGAGCDETENLINEAMRLDGVEVAALLVEADKTVRVSLRSTEPLEKVYQEISRACAEALGCAEGD